MTDTVTTFPGHHWAHCDPGCEGCVLCDGGLSLCTVCRAGEGQLTEDCPGRVMTDEEASAVYAGELDYRVSQGGWTTWTRSREAAAREQVT